MMLEAIIMAAALHSPKGAATFESIAMLERPVSSEYSSVSESETNSPELVPSFPKSFVVPDTNAVYEVTLQWDYTNTCDTFVLCCGKESRTYTSLQIETGTNLFYTLRMTNWSEQYDRHFFAVCAKRNGLTSDFSNEVFDPPYPDDRMSISWVPTNMTRTLQWSSNLKTWTSLTNSKPPVTVMFTADRYFRATGTTNALMVRKFNPLNGP